MKILISVKIKNSVKTKNFSSPDHFILTGLNCISSRDYLTPNLVSHSAVVIGKGKKRQNYRYPKTEEPHNNWQGLW